MKILTKGLLLISAIAMVAAASAQSIVYNNMGNPPTWDLYAGWTIGGLANGQTIFMPFTPSATGTISEVDAAIELQTSNQSGGMFANLWNANSAGAPGTLLETSQIRNDVFTQGLDGFIFSGKANITAGQSYFIQLATTSSSDAVGYWSLIYDLQKTTFYHTTDGGAIKQGYGSDSAFRVLATQAVPEPSSFAALGIGLVGLLGFRRRSK